MDYFEKQIKDVRTQNNRVGMLEDMLGENIKTYCEHNGYAGCSYPKNHNASKTAILNQITTLRNELLVLAECIKR